MSGWLDEDRPGSGPVEGDGRTINGTLHIYRDGAWTAHPVEVLRDVAQDIAATLGLEVDHEAFDRARAYADEPVTR